MGLRVRLKPGYDISALHGQARVIARALQVYGALVADNSGGSKVFISGTPDPGWDDDDLDQLKAIPARARRPSSPARSPGLRVVAALSGRRRPARGCRRARRRRPRAWARRRR